MEEETNGKEKRLALRMSLHTTVVVSGTASDLSSWSEPAHTSDVSNSGAQFQLHQPIVKGQRVGLRVFTPEGEPIEVTAIVVHTQSAIYGMTRVGVLIEESKEDWVRFFVSWVAANVEGNPSPTLGG